MGVIVAVNVAVGGTGVLVAVLVGVAVGGNGVFVAVSVGVGADGELYAGSWFPGGPNAIFKVIVP